MTKSVYNLIDRRSITDIETLEILGMVEKKAAQLKGSFGKLGDIERRVGEMREAGEIGIWSKTEKLRNKVDRVLEGILKTRGKEDSM